MSATARNGSTEKPSFRESGTVLPRPSDAAIDRELRIVGYILHDPEQRLADLEPHLNGGLCFQSRVLRRVYEETQRLGSSASDEAVIARLGPQQFDEIGGTDRLRNATFNQDLIQTAQVRYLADVMVEDYRRREQSRILREAIHRLDDPNGPSFAELDAELTSTLEDFRSYQPAADRLIRHSRSMRDLFESNPPAPPAILEHGALRRGDYLWVYGKSGLGKSQLAMRLAWAWTSGQAFLGLATHGPFRVGLVTPELDSASVIQRYAGIGQLTADEVLATDAIERLRVLDRDTLAGTLDLRRAQDQRELISWIDRYALDVVILDALTDVYLGDLYGEDWVAFHADFVTNLHKRTATGCTPVVFHHQSDKTDDSPTGSASVFTGESSPMRKAALAFWLHRLRGGIVLENVKHRRIRKLPDIWLELDELGVPRVTDAPLDVAERKAGKLDELAEWIREQGGTATTEGIMRQAGVRSNKTARQYAKDLGGTIGAGRNAVWTFPNLTRNAEGGK